VRRLHPRTERHTIKAAGGMTLTHGSEAARDLLARLDALEADR